MMRVKGNLVLFSGGLDSAVLLAWGVRHAHTPIHAVGVDYGQRHRLELDRATVFCHRLDVPYRIVTVGGLFSEAPLVGRPPLGNSIVPGRNLLLASVGYAVAQEVYADRVWLGATAEDDAYPDCSRLFQTAVSTVFAAIGDDRVRFGFPFLDKMKHEVVTLGGRLGVPFELTLSCYDPGPNGEPCGVCNACKRRQAAFKKAGVEDPWQTP